MKKIEQTILGVGEVRGVVFKLIKREGLESLWSRSDGFFEVVKLRQQKAYTTKIQGREISFADKEVYPSGESWGLIGNGKCVKTLEKAEEIFNQRAYGKQGE